jgi:signal transduction histidine kinase
MLPRPMHYTTLPLSSHEKSHQKWWLFSLCLQILLLSLTQSCILLMNTQEAEVRREALLVITLVASVAATFYLVLGVTGGWQSRLYPWDGIWLLAVSVVFGGLTWRFPQSPTTVSVYAAWFLALASQPLFYASQHYGIQHPIMALFILSILAGGLLVGASFSFLGFWVGFFCVWVVLIGIGQFNGRWAPDYPITLANVVAYSAFWCVMYLGSGGLGWFFSRYLKRVLDSSQQQTNALTQSLNALVEDPTLEPFLGRVLGVVVKQFGVEFAPLFLFDGNTGMLRFHLAYLTGQIQSVERAGTQAPSPIPAHQSPLWQELVASRHPVLIPDPATDPRILNQALLKQQGIKTLLAVPLVLGETLLGYFALNSLEVRRYQPQDITLLQSLAQLITLAVQLTRLAEQGEERAILAERNRMAREIHDTLAQGFTGIVMQLEAAEDALEDGIRADVHLLKAKGLARESLAEARRSVRALRPSILEEVNWVDALQETTQRLTHSSGLNVHWEIEPLLPSLPSFTETELYRIAQESMTNIVRHANANQVWVRIRQRGAGVEMEIQDDGVGFDPTQTAGGGFGLLGMRERAEKIGATLELTSQPSQGTTIRAVLAQVPPVTKNGIGE